MYTKQVIKDIEICFSRYCESTSDTMLYYTTKYLLDFLNSFDIVKVVLANLRNKYPYSKATLENRQEGFNVIKNVGQDKKQYISYVLHFLEYSFTTDSNDEFYDEASWICSDNKDYDKKERIKLFKIDVVKPLCDYVIDELRKSVSLLYVLDRFKNRTMRFETPYPVESSERDAQNKLALYLFDNGYLVHREDDLSNGKPDFLFSDEDSNPYIIEVKYVKAKRCTSKKLKTYTSQLRDYMNKLDSYIGVLCVFTTQDYEFIWHNKLNDMEIVTIYVGGLKPSERNTKNISLDLNTEL